MAARVESNFVYGMCGGLALLMDIYHPEQPNGKGVLAIWGSGWHAPSGYDAIQLENSPPLARYTGALSGAGYTVFAINHRAAPMFRYPAALEDAQRAVRFIRHHAGEYGIDPETIGAFGLSSGGHLVSMLGVLKGEGDLEDPDPVNRESARVQCVVARAPSDLSKVGTAVGGTHVADFIGLVPYHYGSSFAAPSSPEYRRYSEASPVSYVSKDVASFLLVHGDADSVMPFEQARIMHDGLQKAGATVNLLRLEGGEHNPAAGAPDPPDYLEQVTGWFDQHLRVVR